MLPRMRALRLLSSLLVITSTGLLAACDDDASDCTKTLKPGADDREAIQTAFIEAESGDTICLGKGTYSLTGELTLANAADVTLKGNGKTRDDVVLDFSAQVTGDDGIEVTAPGFTIENLTVKNSPGNGVVAHAELSTFRNIKVYWDNTCDAPPCSVTDNGFYAVYPTDCRKTIVEDCEVIGASDAGVYVGSCEYAIVRRNKIHGNVAGLEIENSRYSEVYENEVYDNTAGILALVLPNQEIKENRHVLIYDNNIHDNNRDGFAEGGTVVSYVPKGLGMLSLAGNGVEIRGNTISNNNGAGLMVVSFRTFEILTGTTLTDTEMDPYLQNVYIHDNTFTANGTAPAGALSLFGQATLEDVVWDGVLEEGKTAADSKICLGPNPPTFRNLDINGSPSEQTTDTAPHTCTIEPIAELNDFEGIP